MGPLLQSIHRLSASEKFRLLDAIWEDLAINEANSLDPDVLAELDARVQRYRQNPQSAIPWASLLDQVEQQ